MAAVNPRSPIPLHAQIGELMQLRIARGELKPGERLPTVRELAVELAVNSNTVARVYAELERHGVVVTKRGSGTFVASAPPAPATVAARDRRLQSLCREFAVRCARDGFSLAETRRALRAVALAKETP